jgi:hypothetical protein
MEIWEGYLRVWYSSFLSFHFGFWSKIRNSQFPPICPTQDSSSVSSTSMKHISWTIYRMRVCEYPLESCGSIIYLCYSTLGQNLATIVPVLYFLTTIYSQVRFDVSTRSVISRYWLAEPNHVTCHDASEVYDYVCFIVWLKSQPRDLVTWHQKFFHMMASAHRTNVYLLSSHVGCSHWPLNLMIWSSLQSLTWANFFYVWFHLSVDLRSRIIRPILQACTFMHLSVHYR